MKLDAILLACVVTAVALPAAATPQPTTRAAFVRSRPHPSAPRVRAIEPGTMVEVARWRGGWARVTTPYQGWLPAYALGAVDLAAPESAAAAAEWSGPARKDAAGTVDTGAGGSAISSMNDVPGLTATAAGKAPPPGAARHFVSVAVQQDFGLVDGTNVCSREQQLTGEFACFRAEGTPYHGTPANALRIDSALKPATTRLIVGWDRRLFGRLTAGARVGYAFAGAPHAAGAAAHAFMPYHAEARVGWGLPPRTEDPWGIRFVAFVAAGIAQVDARFDWPVVEDPAATPVGSQPENPSQQVLRAYQKMGRQFASGSVGAALSRPWLGTVAIEARVMAMFPTSGLALAPAVTWLATF